MTMITDIRNIEVHENGKLSNEDYHSHDYISGSGLCVIENECPAVLKYGEQKESPALHFGIASHAAMLEPELFEKEFARDIKKEDWDKEVKAEDGTVTVTNPLLTSDAAIKSKLKELGVKGYSTKKGQELIDMLLEAEPDSLIFKVLQEKHAEANKGKVLVPADDYDNIMQMRKIVFANKDYTEMLKGCYVETSIICEIKVKGCDDWIGVKIRPDIITKNCEVPDYKTTRDIKPEPFGRQAYFAGYLLKQAFVCDVLAAVYKTAFKPGLLAQAKASPFIPQLYWLTEKQREIGRMQYSHSLQYWNYCKTNDVWPTYSDTALDLEIPAYVENKYFPN
jgi:hypothetical protein